MSRLDCLHETLNALWKPSLQGVRFRVIGLSRDRNNRQRPRSGGNAVKTILPKTRKSASIIIPSSTLLEGPSNVEGIREAISAITPALAAFSYSIDASIVETTIMQWLWVDVARCVERELAFGS